MTGLTADDLLGCYRMGVFPMGESRDDPAVTIVEPHLRGVIAVSGFHLPRRLARIVRKDVYQITVDQAFGEVVASCAAASERRADTWINRPIEQLYGELHARGVAHSIEARLDGQLAGGLYGVRLGGAFFGESMFSTARDASKVALAHLIARMAAGGLSLLDCQFLTPHLTQFGAEEISQKDYLKNLEKALDLNADFWRLPLDASGQEALQAISQAS